MFGSVDEVNNSLMIDKSENFIAGCIWNMIPLLSDV